MNQPASTSSTRFPGPLNAWWNFRRKRFWLLVVLLSYTLAGFFLVPWVGKRQAVNFVTENLGMELSIDKLRFNPWTLTAEITGMAIGEDAQDPMLGFDRFFVNFQTSSLFNWALTFSEVTLDRPYGEVIQYEDGQLNLLALIPPVDESAEVAAETTVEEEGGPLRWLVQNIAINNGEFSVRDETRPTPFTSTIQPINISLNELTTLPERAGGQQVSITTDSGASLQWSGTIELEPFHSAGQVSANGAFPLLGYEYIQDMLNFELQDGSLNLQLDYVLQSDAVNGFQAEVSNAELQLENIVAVQQGPGEIVEIVNIPNIRVENALMNLAEQRVSVAAVVISEPRFEVWRDDQGLLNVEQLLAPAESSAEAAAVASNGNAEPVQESIDEESNWQIELAEFRIESLAAVATDYTVGSDAAVELASLDLSIQSVSNQPLASFPVTLSMVLASGGTLEASGAVTALPEFSSAIQLNLADLALAVGQPWLQAIAQVQIDSGNLNVQAEVETSPENPFSLQADVTLPEFSMSDMRIQEPLLAWDDIGLDQIIFSLSDNQLNISEIELSAPYVAFHIAEDQSTNLQGILIESQSTGTDSLESVPTAEEPTGETAAPLDVTLGQINVVDAAADFSDLSLPLPFATKITELGGTITTISSSSSEPAEVTLDGVVGEYGLAEINGRIRPLAPMELTDMSVLFANVNMPDLTPYTIRFAGRELDDGRLELDLHYLIEQGQLSAENSIVMSDLQLGDEVEYPDAVSLPLGLAVALLKGPDGSIDIDFPVSGSVDDPEFSIGGVVFRAFVNLITRAVTAPFSLLGNLVGAGGDDFGRVGFRAGVAELAPPDREKLDQLVEALLQRPNLSLVVAGVIDPVADASSLQTMRVQTEIETRSNALPEGGAQSLFVSRRRQVMEGLAQERLSVDLTQLQAEFLQPADPAQAPATPALDEPAYLAALEQQLIDAEPIGQAELDLLGQARAVAMVAQLMASGQLDAARIEQSSENSESEIDEDGWIVLELEVGAN